MNFKNKQRKRVLNLMEQNDIFSNDKGNGVFRREKYSFILQEAKNNLFPEITNKCIEYFKKNKIAWWMGKELTNHPLSSQIACLNHLFLIRNDKQAVLGIIKAICPEITDVLEIKTDSVMPAFIQFEAVSDTDHLDERTSTRGSNCTSIDALIYGVRKDGRKILFPIEWKYTEVYYNTSKGCDNAGETRKKRYTNLINDSKQLNSDNHDIYYFEPFYQLMRQTIWAEQIVKHKATETIKVDDFIHIHVIPTDNYNLIEKVYKCSGKDMESTWKDHLKSQEKYVVISPESLLAPLDPIRYKKLIKYLRERYW